MQRIRVTPAQIGKIEQVLIKTREKIQEPTNVRLSSERVNSKIVTLEFDAEGRPYKMHIDDEGGEVF